MFLTHLTPSLSTFPPNGFRLTGCVFCRRRFRLWIPKLKSKKDTAFFEPPDEPEENRPYEDDGSGWDKTLMVLTMVCRRRVLSND